MLRFFPPSDKTQSLCLTISQNPCYMPNITKNEFLALVDEKQPHTALLIRPYTHQSLKNKLITAFEFITVYNKQQSEREIKSTVLLIDDNGKYEFHADLKKYEENPQNSTPNLYIQLSDLLAMPSVHEKEAPKLGGVVLS